MTLAAVQKLYMSEEQRDVVFYVGPDERCRVRFPAHKLVLRSASPVFCAMFSDGFSENESGEVFVKDITPAVFRNILKFAYIGNFKASTVVSYADTLYAADKYLMSELSKFCFSQLENFPVSVDNFWNFFNIVRQFYSESMSPEIVVNTLQFLDDNADKILACEEFQNLNLEAVSSIVSRSTLKNTCEIEVLRHILQWSKSECSRQNLEINAENVQQIMKDLKFHVRYLLIPREELLKIFTNVGFLTQKDKTFFLEASFHRNRLLILAPRKINKLARSRGRGFTLQFPLQTSENTNPAEVKYISKSSVLLVTAQDCVLEEIVMSTAGRMTQVVVEITDLNGNIFDTWTEKYTTLDETSILIGKSTCLKKFKPYKLNLVGEPGCFVNRFKGSALCNDFNGELCLFVGNFPKETSMEIKSCEFWEKILNGVSKIPESLDTRGTNMTRITIKV